MQGKVRYDGMPDSECGSGYLQDEKPKTRRKSPSIASPPHPNSKSSSRTTVKTRRMFRRHQKDYLHRMVLVMTMMTMTTTTTKNHRVRTGQVGPFSRRCLVCTEAQKISGFWPLRLILAYVCGKESIFSLFLAKQLLGPTYAVKPYVLV